MMMRRKRSLSLDGTVAPSIRSFSSFYPFSLDYPKKLKTFWNQKFLAWNPENKFLIFNFSFPGFPLSIKKNKKSTKSSNNAQHQPHNLLSTSTTLSKNDANLTLSHNHLPSRWYTVLALPFPDQKLARRDISTFGRHGFYQSRAGFFSEPSPPLWNLPKHSTNENAIMCHSFDFQNICDYHNHV